MNKKPFHISVLGDSISTFDGISPPGGVYYGPSFGDITGVRTPEDTWWMQVIQAMGGTFLANNSWSGSTVSMVGNLPACTLSRIKKLAADGVEPDHILIFAGLNDVAFFAEPAAFATDYGLMLQRIKDTYPQAQVTCGTLVTGYLKDTPFTHQLGHIREKYLPYNQAILETAAQFGYQTADIASFNERFAPMDGFHPNGEGMSQLADFWLKSVGLR